MQVMIKSIKKTFQSKQLYISQDLNEGTNHQKAFGYGVGSNNLTQIW